MYSWVRSLALYRNAFCMLRSIGSPTRTGIGRSQFSAWLRQSNQKNLCEKKGQLIVRIKIAFSCGPLRSQTQLWGDAVSSQTPSHFFANWNLKTRCRPSNAICTCVVMVDLRSLQACNNRGNGICFKRIVTCQTGDLVSLFGFHANP